MEISSICRADRVDLIHLTLHIYQKKEAEKYSETLWLLTKREQWKNSLSLITLTYLYPRFSIYFSVIYFINSYITSPWSFDRTAVTRISTFRIFCVHTTTQAKFELDSMKFLRSKFYDSLRGHRFDLLFTNYLSWLISVISHSIPFI